jgi:hypothetical protein
MATGSTMVVLFKFWTCPYLTYLATLPTSGQSICTFTGTVDILMVAMKNDFLAFVPFKRKPALITMEIRYESTLP